ncbi:MAG: hypothetical protein HY453_02140 [Parcubacteria group bacterium]|nr:hypothetical protein [Parcubacteria group bacterium]
MNLKNMGEKMKAIFEQLINVHITGRIHNLDLSDSVFSGYLLDYLRSKIHGKDMSENVGEVFSVLTTPLEESLAQKEYADILAILESIKGDEKLLSTYQNFDTPIILKTIRQKFLKNYQRIVKHVERYGWLGYGYSGPAWGEEYFVDILASLSKQKVSLSEYSKAEEEKRSVIMARQKEYFAKLGIDDRHKKLLEIAREFVFLKGARKDAMFHWYSALEFPYRELARRFFLSLKQVRYYYWWEWLDILSKEKKVDANLLNERIAYHIYYCDEKDNFHTVNGDDAKKFLGRFQIMTPDISNINELNGDCASPGKVRAKTVLVNTKQDMQKMKKGDILVSTATMPELMPAIKLASAIITDMGGITCHAAIVSRELGIPCVIGTKIATKVLKDGTTVEVDASHGRVRIITS